MKIVFYIFTVLFLCKISSAQNPAYFKLGEKQFSNTDIYTLLFDESNEVLYAGTNNGLYIYKQNKFVQLKSPRSQIGTSLFSLKQNSDGDIFCNNLNGQIFKIKNDSLSLFYSIPDNESTKNFHYFVINNNEFFVATVLEAKILTTDGAVSKTLLKGEKVKNTILGIRSVSQLPNGKLYITYSNKNKVYTYHNNQLDSLSVDFKKTTAHSTFFSINNRIISMCKGGNINSSTPFVFQNYIPKNKEQIIFFDHNKLIGLGQKKGIHFLKYKNDTIYQGQHFFDEKFISAFCKNNNNVLFFGSFGDGVYVVPKKEVLILEYKHLFLGMAMLNDTLFLSSREGDIFKNNKGLKLVSTHDFNIDNIFPISNNFSFNDITQKGLIYTTKKDINYALKDVIQIDSHILLEASPNGISLRTSSEKVLVKQLDFIEKRGLMYTIYEGKRCNAVSWSSKDSLIYYSTGFGVFYKKWSSSKTQQLLFKGNTFLGKDLEFYTDTLICGTEKNGVLLFKNNKLLLQLSEKDGLMSNLVKKVHIFNGKIYILSKAGFQIYNLETNHYIKPGIKEGVLNNSITNFEVTQNKLWLLEKHRFYAIDLNLSYQIEQASKLYIDSISINNQVIDYTTKNKFDFNENQFEFYYDYRDLLSKNETEILFTLEGFYDDWKTTSTKHNKIEFQSLPTGKYTFKIKAKHQSKETIPFTYSFTISPPFWQAWWFYLLVLVIITLTFWSRLRYQKKKSQLLNEVNTSKLTAIQSQMNPHFIFNALNSIQALVLRGDIDKSYAYINQFSSLVRKTLNFSEKDFIEFDSEIQLIEVYLSLEKLRFREDFEYSINLPEEDEFLVPPMLIQPFIENALVHGLLHKTGLKTIEISFKVSDTLECTIIDNGIGRKESAEINKRQNPEHESFAIKALENRLEILSKRFKNPIGFNYEDLYDENNNATGTKVVVKIPIIHEF